jgi:gas vesicle protein
MINPVFYKTKSENYCCLRIKGRILFFRRICSSNLTNRIMRPQKIIIGALAGLAAGALIGILFAPDKGSVVRDKISKKGEDYLDSIKSSFNSFLDGISVKVDKVKEDAAEIIDSRKRESKREMQTSAS